MPIEVELPSGDVVEFPDGTNNATMERALSQYRAPAAKPAPRPAAAPKQPAGVGEFSVEGAKRSLGLGTRNVIAGLGDLVGIVANPFIEGVNALGDRGVTQKSLITGQPDRRFPRQATLQEGAEALSDYLGLPEPVNAEERVAGGITRALTGAATPIALGRQLAIRAPGVVQAVGEGLASNPGAQITAATGGATASETAREAGVGPTGQILAGLSGAIAPGGARAAVSEGVRRVARGGEAGRQVVERNIRDFGTVGATPSVGQATENRAIQGVENLLAGGPTSAPVMGRFIEGQAEDIGRGLGAMADDIAPGRASASAERAGRAIEKGVSGFVDEVKAKRRELYNAADAAVPNETIVRPDATRANFDALTALTPGAEATSAGLINPRIQQMATNLRADLDNAARMQGTNGLPYAALKDLRSRIGEELSDFALSADRPTAQYKRLYAALSDDLERATAELGPDAQRAMRRANDYFRASQSRIDQIERVVDKVGGPEKVYNATLAGTRDGATTLRAVLQSLPKDGQRDLAAAVIKRMGLARAGEQGAAGDAFSASTFLTNWNNVSPEAKRALFDRLGPKYASNVDALARVAENIRTGAKVYANPSGTANRAAAGAYLLSLAGAAVSGNAPLLGGLAGGGVSANLLARGLTNPKFVGWLANATRMPKEAVPQAILQLQRDATKSGDDDLAALAAELQQRQAAEAEAGQ